MSEYLFCDPTGKLMPINPNQHPKYKSNECGNKKCEFQYGNKNKSKKCNGWHPCTRNLKYIGAPCGINDCKEDHHLESIDQDQNKVDDSDGKEEYIAPINLKIRACSFFQNDKCSNTAEKCKFNHVKVAAGTNLCYNFHSKTGDCEFGKSCRHIHMENPNQNQNQNMGSTLLKMINGQMPLSQAASSSKAAVAALPAVSTVSKPTLAAIIANQAVCSAASTAASVATVATVAPVAAVSSLPASSSGKIIIQQDELNIVMEISKKEAEILAEAKKKEQDELNKAIEVSKVIQNVNILNNNEDEKYDDAAEPDAEEYDEEADDYYEEAEDDELDEHNNLITSAKILTANEYIKERVKEEVKEQMILFVTSFLAQLKK